jgi:hypothetical protein
VGLAVLVDATGHAGFVVGMGHDENLALLLERVTGDEPGPGDLRDVHPLVL